MKSSAQKPYKLLSQIYTPIQELLAQRSHFNIRLILGDYYFYKLKIKTLSIFLETNFWVGMQMTSFENLTTEKIMILTKLRNEDNYKNMSRR